jgi:hypothetical protein
MYKLTYKDADLTEEYECENIHFVAIVITDLVSHKGYDESQFKIEWVN